MSKDKVEHIIINKSLAVKYGLVESICMQHLASWISYNESKKQNYKNGRYWTRIPIKNIHNQNKYLTISQIRSAVDSLVNKHNVLLKQHHYYNNTCEYSFKDKKDLNEVLKTCFILRKKRKNLFSLFTILLSYIKSLCEISKPIDIKVLKKNFSSKTFKYETVRQDLTSREVDSKQIPELLEHVNYNYNLILDKIKQHDFLKQYYPEKIKGSGSYLYNAIKKDWIDSKYKYNIKPKPKQYDYIILPDENKSEKKEDNLDKLNKELKEKALKYYNSLPEENKKQIDIIAKNNLESTHYYKNLGEKQENDPVMRKTYLFKLETEKINYIINNKLMNIERVGEELRKSA